MRGPRGGDAARLVASKARNVPRNEKAGPVPFPIAADGDSRETELLCRLSLRERECSREAKADFSDMVLSNDTRPASFTDIPIEVLA